MSDSRNDSRAEDPRVLVVDDFVPNHDLLSAQLQHLGCGPVVFATGVSQALKLLEHDGESFALVITDLRLGDGSGLSLIRSIREFEGVRGGARTPIVLVSAEIDEQSIEDAYAAKCDYVLEKPLLLRVLRRLIFETVFAEKVVG